MKYLTNLGGRRYTLCVMTLIAATILQALGKLDAAGLAWGGTLVSIVGAFITGDVFENKHTVEAGRASKQSRRGDMVGEQKENEE